MKGVFSFLILMFASSSVYAEWKVLRDKESGGLIELDTSRSRKLKNNYIAVIREYLAEQQIELKTEINCAKKKHKLIFEKIRDIKGNIIQEHTKPKPWQTVEPGTVFDIVMLKLCQENVTK